MRGVLFILTGILMIHIAINADLGSMIAALIIPQYMTTGNPNTASNSPVNNINAILGTSGAGISSGIGGIFLNPNGK